MVYRMLDPRLLALLALPALRRTSPTPAPCTPLLLLLPIWPSLHPHRRRSIFFVDNAPSSAPSTHSRYLLIAPFFQSPLYLAAPHSWNCFLPPSFFPSFFFISASVAFITQTMLYTMIAILISFVLD